MMASFEKSLSKFRNQQAKCQSTLTTINAAKAGSSKPNTLKFTFSSPSTLANSKLFSVENEDIQRLQLINRVRSSPIGSQIKRVIDLLFETRQALTIEQINEKCHVDAYQNRAVFDSLKNNPKLSYDGSRFSYKSKYDVKDKGQLLFLLRKFPEGIPVIDLKDSYPSVIVDLQSLKASGDIRLVASLNFKEGVAYANDPRAVIKVDDDIKQLYRGINLPREMLDIEKDLRKNGMKPATDSARRKAMAQVLGIVPNSKTKKKRAREMSKRTKLTNVHLPELFQNLNVPRR